MIGLLKKLFGGSKVDYKDLVSKGALIADVRTPAEYKDGHIANSKNIPLDSISAKIAELKKLNMPIITVCRSGARSGMAKNMLKSAGLEVYNGGAWTSLKNKL